MSQPGQFPLTDMPGIIFFFGLPLRIGRHEHFPIHMRTHLIKNLKQPVIQSDDHAYPLKTLIRWLRSLRDHNHPL